MCQRRAGRMPCRRPPASFIELVENQVHIPVKVIGVGAERDDYLLWTA